MSWAYIQYDEDGERLACKMPPQGSACLVYDGIRQGLRVGHLEESGSGPGYDTVLCRDGHLSDDCQWLAWAPLNETERLDRSRLDRSRLGPSGPTASAARAGRRCTLVMTKPPGRHRAPPGGATRQHGDWIDAADAEPMTEYLVRDDSDQGVAAVELLPSGEWWGGGEKFGWIGPGTRLLQLPADSRFKVEAAIAAATQELVATVAHPLGEEILPMSQHYATQAEAREKICRAEAEEDAARLDVVAACLVRRNGDPFDRNPDPTEEEDAAIVADGERNAHGDGLIAEVRTLAARMRARWGL